MAVTMTSIRLDTELADEAVRVLGAKSRTRRFTWPCARLSHCSVSRTS